MKMLIINLIWALTLTVLIEGVAVIYNKPRKRVLLASVLGNILTNPLLNLVIIIIRIKWSGMVYATTLICGEVLAIIVEAKVYRAVTGLTLTRCFMISMFANCVSYFVGVMLYGF